MCELLGLSFNKPVRPQISFTGFRERGRNNPHGWGLAFYQDKAAQIFKEPLKAGGSNLAEFVQDYREISSKLFISHVRLSSVGGESYKNTHPFRRVLNGKEYIFAHNGTLRKFRTLKTGRFLPLGGTDSEHVFCHLLHCIEQRKISDWKERDFTWLNSKLKEINKYGRFNCLFSNGEFMFCYHDVKGYNGLFFVHRKPPYSDDAICLKDKDWQIQLSREKSPEETGFVIATRPLTDEDWHSFIPGSLVIFKGGKRVFGHKNFYFSEEKQVLKILRNSPHKVALKSIIRKSHAPEKLIKSTIKSLCSKEWIRQDGRDTVGWDDGEANYYTLRNFREKIDKIISG
ncbi:class II glutamine amidotransferase [Candidatus Riflebacteria bacterium]